MSTVARNIRHISFWRAIVICLVNHSGLRHGWQTDKWIHCHWIQLVFDWFNLGQALVQSQTECTLSLRAFNPGSSHNNLVGHWTHIICRLCNALHWSFWIFVSIGKKHFFHQVLQSDVMIDDAVNYSTSVKSIKLNRGIIMNHHQLKRRDSVWLTSQQMTDLPTPTDEYNGWPDKIFQMLRYTIYRAISESDDAKGQKDAQSLVAGASNSSSSSSRSGSLTVRSHGVTTQIQQIITFQIQKAMDDVLSELALMEQAMYSQLQFDPVMRPANHQYFYAWHEAVIGVRRQFVSVIQKKSTRFKTWKPCCRNWNKKGGQPTRTYNVWLRSTTMWRVGFGNLSRGSSRRALLTLILICVTIACFRLQSWLIRTGSGWSISVHLKKLSLKCVPSFGKCFNMRQFL